MRTIERIGWAGASAAIALGAAACQSETPVPPKPTHVTTSPTPSPSVAPTAPPTSTPSVIEHTQPPIVYSRKIDSMNGEVTETGMFHVFDDDTGMFEATISNGTVDIRSIVLDVRCQDDDSITATATTYVYDSPKSDSYNTSKSPRNKRIIIPNATVTANHYCDNNRINVKSNLGTLAIAIMKKSVQRDDTPTDPNLI
jgi:hypothetical protein